MGIIGWIAVGVAAGLLANMLFPGKRATGLIFTALTGITAVLGGDWTAALAAQDRLVRLHKALFLDSSPAPTKFALAHLGLCTDEVRLPIAPCADAVKPAILEAMREAGVLD